MIIRSNPRIPEHALVPVGKHWLAMTRSGRGPSVVLLHGIPTSSFLWRYVRPHLLTAGYSVITLDLLGYGASDQPADTDLGIEAQASHVAKALSFIGWRNGTIVGHDIGGGVAQIFAMRKPACVNALVLVDTIAYDSFPEPGIARLKDPAWDAILGDPAFDLKKGLTKGFKRGLAQAELVTPELIDTYERPFSGVAGRLAYLRAARALRTEDLARHMPEIEKLNTPTLIVWGKEDVYQPIRYGERLAAAMPRAEFHAFAGAGHFLPEDAPDRLSGLIVDFLQRNRETAK
jgi:pimeloyl-ACP methyl ester carboxylesterase